jgi:signal peptidase II
MLWQVSSAPDLGFSGLLAEYALVLDFSARVCANPEIVELVKEKLTLLATIIPSVLLLDFITKRWALAALDGGVRLEILGGFVPLTLAFNRGAAFGISIGDDSRWFFIPITILALVLLLVLLRQAERRDWLRLVSISMVVSGALGNLYDRVRWNRGVVDFIGPIDLGVMDWPIFNVADMSITCGAVLLAFSFWGEERRERAAAIALKEGEPTATG